MGEGDQGELVKAATTALDTSTSEVARLRAKLEADRDRTLGSFEELHDAVEDFRESVEEKLDWRRFVKEHPWETVGAAFVIGFLLGSG